MPAFTGMTGQCDHAHPFAEGFLGWADLHRHRRRLCPARPAIPPRRHASHGTGDVPDAHRRAAGRAGLDHRAALVRARRRSGAAFRRAADRHFDPGHRPIRHRAAMDRSGRRHRGARAGRSLRFTRGAAGGQSRARSGHDRVLGRGVRVAARPAAAALADVVSRVWSCQRTIPHFAIACGREARMETLSNLAFGLGVALSWQNVLYCFIGCFLGTLVGVLPGIGPVATVAMLLPFTFGLNPAPALIMLAGIYYGAQYGGSTTAILVNIPGESSSVVTTLDGHQMARRGRAGPRSASRRSAPSSPAVSPRWSSPISPRRLPSSHSNSVRRNIFRSWYSG